MAPHGETITNTLCCSGPSEDAPGCVSDRPKVVHFWRIRHGCGILKDPSNLANTYVRAKNLNKPQRLSNDNIQRTLSDISIDWMIKEANIETNLPPISEVENAKCECCGMSEEFTHEYIEKVRKKYLGKWICGLCGEAVKEEAEKNGGNNEEALSTHISICSKFNKFGRAYPVLYQAQAMREMLKKSARDERGILRAKSISPRDKNVQKKGGISRSTSCIPAITKDINDLN